MKVDSFRVILPGFNVGFEFLLPDETCTVEVALVSLGSISKTSPLYNLPNLTEVTPFVGISKHQLQISNELSYSTGTHRKNQNVFIFSHFIDYYSLQNVFQHLSHSFFHGPPTLFVHPARLGPQANCRKISKNKVGRCNDDVAISKTTTKKSFI